MTRDVHVVIAGGGTGGHLFPGLAVAEQLRGRGVRVSFIGTRRGIEAKVVPGAGYPLYFIDVAGLKRMGALGTLRSALRLPGAGLAVLRLLRAQRPQAVVGVGGYASGPVVAVAALSGIPTAVLEQNSVPGVTNRILGRLVRRVFIAFPAAASYFPGRDVQLLGNPIRGSLRSARAGTGEARARVLVLGGSQGAHAINELMMGAMTHLVAGKTDRGRLPRVLHQTGAADEQAVRACYRELGLSDDDVRVEAFIDDMAAAYAGCDLVVGRAGATTLAEITALGLPAVLVPLPTAADDHQTKNARWLEEQGAARVLVQGRTTPDQLASVMMALCQDHDTRGRMAQASKLLGRPDAAAAVASGILDLL